MLKLLSKYIKQLTKFQLNRSDGFYILPYFGSSPEDLINGFDYMPFIHVDKELGTIRSNSFFLEALTYFHKIENGLWLTFGKVKYKKNISYKRIQDEELKAGYYFLSLEITRESAKKSSTIVNGYNYKNYTWLLFKPEISNSHSHLSNSVQESITIWFDEKFMRNRLLKNAALKDSSLVKFLQSEKQMVIWPSDADFAEQMVEKLSELFALKSSENVSETAFAEIATQIFEAFSETYSTAVEDFDFTQVNPATTRKMLQANRILMEYVLRDDFEGIEWLAEKVHMSPTHLKQNFKKVFGVSIYQHLKQKKMQHAMELLKTTETSVKEIANIIGYHNPAKFSSAFKEQFGNKPTDMRQAN